MTRRDTVRKIRGLRSKTLQKMLREDFPGAEIKLTDIEDGCEGTVSLNGRTVYICTGEMTYAPTGRKALARIVPEARRRLLSVDMRDRWFLLDIQLEEWMESYLCA